MEKIYNSMPESQAIAIVSPFPPPYGGMAIQAEMLVSLLRKSGVNVIPVQTNCDFRKTVRFLSKFPFVKTFVNLAVFMSNLHRVLQKVNGVYFLTGFFNFFFWVTYPALILIKVHGKKVVLSARGGAARLFFRRYGLLLRPILKKVDVITTPSGFLRDIFRETLNIEPLVVPNLIDLTQFRFRDRHQFRPRLLVTRNLEMIYDVECVIRAFKAVRDHFPDARLGIVGEGKERKHLEDLVSTLNLHDSVVFYGSVKHDAIQNLYAQYDIFVNASRFDNFPGSILEAFASGVPVVTTKAGGIPYMIEDGVTGLLVDIGDASEMAKKIIHLLEHQDLASTLANNARRASEMYTWRYVRNLLLPILQGKQMDRMRILQ